MSDCLWTLFVVALTSLSLSLRQGLVGKTTARPPCKLNFPARRVTFRFNFPDVELREPNFLRHIVTRRGRRAAMMEVASAVRLPSPEPDLESQDQPRKRERSPYDGPSSGPSKRSRRDGDREDEERDGRVKENGRRFDDEQGETSRRPPPKPTVNDLPADDSRMKLFQNAFSSTRKLPVDDSKTRAGGAYIPPARLREMQKQITDKKKQQNFGNQNLVHYLGIDKMR